jgi:hypothetical protein
MKIAEAVQVINAAMLADDTVLMEGLHGIGKSQIVQQFARDNGFHLVELFLSHQEVGDLIGIPDTKINDKGEKVTVWSVPVWLDRIHQMAAKGIKSIVFLDELNRAPIDVRQSALQLVLERKIHEHELPTVDGSRTMIVSAINPASDYQVDELDPALLDRFLHIQVEADAPSWLVHARDVKANNVVRDFISEHPDRLHWMPQDGGTGATPRSWIKLGKYIDNQDKIAPEIMFQIMKGKIGTEIGSQFFSFYKNYVDVVKMVDIEKVVKDNKDKYEKIEDLSVLVRDLTEKTEAIQKTEMAHQLKEKYSKKKDMLPFVAYLYCLDVEICVAFLKGLRKDDPSAYKSLVDFDTVLNNKELFKRIVVLSHSEAT